MSVEMDKLEASVAKTKGAAASAKALIVAAAAFIRNNAQDPVKLKAFADELDTDSTELSDAVVANPLPTDPVPPTP